MSCQTTVSPFKIKIHPIGVMVIVVGCFIAFALHGAILAKKIQEDEKSPTDNNDETTPGQEE